MKKMTVCLIAIFTMSLSVFAVEVSIGTTLVGWGPSFGRGNNWDTYYITNNWTTSVLSNGIKHSSSFAPVADIRATIDFTPYIAMEVGLGYSIKNIAVSCMISHDMKIKNLYNLNQITVPLIFKLQYEIENKVNIYLGLGHKFNFNVKPPTRSFYRNDEIQYKENVEKELYNILSTDFSFLVGAEARIADVHYVGLRVGYDLNLRGNFNMSVRKYNNNNNYNYPSHIYVKSDVYIDNLNLSLTYRYKFRKQDEE